MYTILTIGVRQEDILKVICRDKYANPATPPDVHFLTGLICFTYLSRLSPSDHFCPIVFFLILTIDLRVDCKGSYIGK